MATPLYKKFKNRGTTFLAFPSASQDMNLAFQNDNYKLSFTKFMLLDFPEQDVVNAVSGRDQEKGVMNFDKDDDGPVFFNFQPGKNADLPTDFGDQLVESLRNYVANDDSTLRESRINVNTDFFNVNELVKPTESIFWKWCKKLNLLDFEPALHKIDWDKNLPDFDNNNGTANNYFQKYLWKERDVNYYESTLSQATGNIAELTINQQSKYKVGDSIMLSGDTGTLSANTAYEVLSVTITTTGTTIVIDTATYTDSSTYNPIVYLDYTKFIKYIGDVQAVSKVQTSRRNFTELTAQVPHHAGATPTILFETYSNSNYYPGLEMPILPAEQQEEIVGAENLNSPIRLNPTDYPGTQYGYFDTEDKTYKCSNGDKLRYRGAYYGLLLNNNIGTEEENYFEELDQFNSDDIDGLRIDFDRDHYLKMNLPDTVINNFDEFNSSYFDGPPEDFDFNAILWYYEMDDGSGNIVTNLYGIEFLNNPNDDNDDADTENKLITPYKKLVSNGEQDGLSYIFNLNVSFDIDNDALPLSYDPTTMYNQFGFDLYQNILQNNAKLQENFVSIISGFTSINEEVYNIKSMVYSQTDITKINSQIENLNQLLQLYSTFQFKDSDSALIETNYEGSYPTLKVNVIDKKYDDITDVGIIDIFTYNETNSGSSYIVSVPLTNQMMLNVTNDNNDIDGTAKILLNRDLADKQAMDIYIKPNLSASAQILDINILYNDGTTTSEQTLISNIDLPIDLTSYDALNPTGLTYKTNSYFTNDNPVLYAAKLSSYDSGTTTTTIKVVDIISIFDTDDYVYIDNFYWASGTTTVIDYSGVYLITSAETSLGDNIMNLSITLDTENLTLRSSPKITYYKGWKINILRTSSISSSSLEDRYQITKELL